MKRSFSRIITVIIISFIISGCKSDKKLEHTVTKTSSKIKLSSIRSLQDSLEIPKLPIFPGALWRRMELENFQIFP